MSADTASAEPTMEEILASIRRIISEDDPASQPLPPQDDPADVLELTEPVAAPEPAPLAEDDLAALFETAQPAPAPEPEPAADEDLMVSDWAEEEPAMAAPEPEPEPAPPPTPEPVMAAPEPPPVLRQTIPPAPLPVDPIVSPVTVAAASSALARLQSITGPSLHGEPIGGITVEALARELLRPMMKEWLEVNLPGIVEAHVAAEVARIGRGR